MELANEYPVRTIARESAGWTIAFGVLLIILGFLALMSPLIAGVAVAVMIGWLLILGGGAHMVLSWHLRGTGGLIWELLIGLSYIIMGIFLLAHPLAGLLALTVFLGVYLFIKGIFELIMWFRLRRVRVHGGGWVLFDAVISLLLALMIWRHFPYAATWFIGTLVGFGILFSGISRLVLGIHAKRLAAAIP
jgi:uncharacterized membrane protein HdeD (DUF308 family)